MPKAYWGLKYHPKTEHSKPYMLLYDAQDFTAAQMQWIATVRNSRCVAHRVYFSGQVLPQNLDVLRKEIEVKFFDGGF